MKKKLAVLLSIVIIFAMISGCSSKSSTASNKNVKILFSISNGTDNYLKLLVSGAEEYAKSKNIDLNIRDASESMEKQMSQMKEAAEDGYDAIICTAVNADIALELKKAAQGIPIIFMNNSIDDNLLEKNKYIYVGSDEIVAGKYQAEYIADYLKNKSDIKMVLLEGERGSTASDKRSKAVKDTFKEKGINVEYVFDDYANWDRQRAKEMFNIFLSTNRKFDGVICNNDEMALGVIDSLKEHEINPESVLIAGIDATADGLKAVGDGSMKLTVYQNAREQSKSAVDAAIQLGLGSDISKMENVSEDGKHIWVPFEKVDKVNVGKYS